MKVEEVINELGLDSYKKEVYRWLLKVDGSTAKEICDETKVPYGKIYVTLNELEKLGLISILPTEPKTYKAIEPKLAFKILFEKQKNEIEEKIKALERLEKIEKIRKPKTENEIIVLKGREKYMQLMKQMIDKTKKEFLLIPGKLSKPTVPVRIAFLRILEHKKDLKMIIREIDNENKEFIKERVKVGAKIRKHNLEGLRLAIRDNDEIMLSIVDPETKDRISVYTTNKWFVNSMRKLFNSLWKESKKMKICQK